jgi:hypothetical protein
VNQKTRLSSDLKKRHFVQTILEPSLKWLKEEELVQRPTLSHEEGAMTPLRLHHTQQLSHTTIAQDLSEHFAMSMDLLFGSQSRRLLSPRSQVTARDTNSLQEGSLS